MRKTIFFFLLAIHSCLIFSQSDFREGYIINQTNDTIKGFIDYRGNKSNATKCFFKKNLASETIIYKPEMILSYRFENNKYYISKRIKNKNYDKSFFLEYLINGIYSIYYYTDDYGEFYFLEGDTGKLVALKNDEQKLKVDKVSYVKESKQYIGILKYSFRESPKISRKAEFIKLNHKSLIDITEDYHKEVCSDKACIIYKKKIPKTKKAFGLVIGANATMISINKNVPHVPYAFKNAEFGVNMSPAIGVFFERNLPLINERVYLMYQATYSYLKLENSNQYYGGPNYFTFDNTIKYSQNTLNNLFIMKYVFSKKKIQPNIQVGGFLNYSFQSDYERKEVVYFEWGQTYDSRTYTNNPFNKIDYGLSLGTGFSKIMKNKKKMFIDLQYKLGFGFFQGMTTNVISINCGFQLGK